MTDPTCPVEILRKDMAVDLRLLGEAIRAGMDRTVTLARLENVHATLTAGLAHIEALVHDDHSERF